MKRFVYEIYYIKDNEHAVEYWEAENYRTAKKEIFESYNDDYYQDVCPCVITMIAEIKYERTDDYGFRQKERYKTILEHIYDTYRKSADEIGWKNYSINELFFKYIEHENEPDADNYFAGIVCRVWGYAGRIYVQCNRHIPFEECYDCVIDTIRYVLNKRVWEDPNSSLYKDPTAPDKAFHVAVKRQRGIMLAKLNTNMRKSNFNVLSLDEFHDEYSDAADGLLFEINNSEDNVIHLISSYFYSNDYLNAIFLDLICYNNYSKFSLQRIIKDLKSLNMDCFEYYDSTYVVDKDMFEKTLKTVKKYSDKLLLNKLKCLLNEMKGVENND